MKTKILERKIEQETYNIIDELSEELNLPVPFYPEVYYINRKSKFETLGLPKRGWEDFELVKKYKNSLCSNRPPIILIGDKDIGNTEQTKKVLIADNFAYEEQITLYPHSDIEQIKINYNQLKPAGSFSLFGWRPGWLGWYIIFSIAFSIGLRKVLKVY